MTPNILKLCEGRQAHPITLNWGPWYV